jgi:DNA repair ATPase RecN
MDIELKKAIAAYIGESTLRLKQDEIENLESQVLLIPALKEKSKKDYETIIDMTDRYKNQELQINNTSAHCRDLQRTIDSNNTEIQSLNEKLDSVYAKLWGLLCLTLLSIAVIFIQFHYTKQ